MVDSTAARVTETAILVLGLVAAATAGCASGPQTATQSWPDVDVAPESTPSDLETDSPSPVLRRASDGFLYAVGSIPDGAEPGTPFIAQYSGDWPVERAGRPPLAAGRVVRQTDDNAAVVHVTYSMPDVDLEGLEVKWEDSVFAAPVGKGLHRIDSTTGGDQPAVTFQNGEDRGVRAGDVYGLLAPGSSIGSPTDVQLTRRLATVCRVTEVGESRAVCRYHAPENGPSPEVSEDHVAVFLEHTLEKAPQEAVVQVAPVENADDDLTKRLRETFESTVGARSRANVDIGRLDSPLDATRDDFHRVESEVDYAQKPQMVAAASVVERDGKRHLVVNYTGIGPVAGPGMVAAPPTGGVDLGPLSAVEARDLEQFAATVYAGLLVYRGQTTQALGMLRNLLRHADFEGPLRWHARDQYAMRWGALDYYEEALWLVLEDERIAERRDHRRARLNAYGTKVRLYDFLGQSERALEAADTYLEEQSEAKPGTEWLSAVGMRSELAASSGDVETVRADVETLEKQCADDCRRDLFAYLSSIWWALPDGTEESGELQDELLDRLLELGRAIGPRQLAAARVAQGMNQLRDGDPDEGLIGFLEATRLYENAGDRVGRARGEHLAMVANIRREKLQSAFQRGQKAAKLRKQLRDVEGLARTYHRLSGLYGNIDFEKRPGRYLRSARSVLRTGFEYQRARGDFGRAAESLFTLGSFLLQFGQTKAASGLLQKASGFGISATRFDIAAMSHLYLAVIAQRNDERSTFRDEIARAKNMAKLADSPEIDRAIERITNPDSDSGEGGDVPTQLL